ncbi:hypothetical protein SLEP1_g9944 [Rubroshorea leprosula]|uniref:Glycosyl transferase family 1 domain-containing protein n=1 Tax=Rubroshorea leprosula TaxID=152421 RepID=A0AAV5I6H6_9ROSI|nr:hypothetical protein SLEP1_g9944 [Rubroshorea leprosula]
MGSLETGISVMRTAASRNGKQSSLSRTVMVCSRFFLFKRLDYVQWICSVLVFLVFVTFFQTFLPGSVVEKFKEDSVEDVEVIPENFRRLKEIGGFDFGEDIRIEPTKLLEKFKREGSEVHLSSSSSFNRSQHRFEYRKPQLALVFPDLLVDPQQLLMVTVAAALRELGYAIQVYSLKDGPVLNIWQSLGVPVTILQAGAKVEIVVDWLNYDGILICSLEVKDIISSLMQEPFKSVPVIWTIHERTLAIRSREYASSGQTALMNDWKKVFNRATVVVFQNYALPMIYSKFDTGNYYVVPGSPAEAWKAKTGMKLDVDNPRVAMDFGPDFLIVVGNQFSYKGLWLEHALILQALFPLFANNTNSQAEIIVLSGELTSNYGMVIECIAFNLGYPGGVVKHVAFDGDVDGVLSMASLVIHGSFLEEPSFPEILTKAMSLGKPIIAPDLPSIRKHVDDRVNGYLFSKENITVLTQIILQVISNWKLSSEALSIALKGKETVKNMMVLDTVEGYALLLEDVVKLPSETAPPKAVKNIPPILKNEWLWNLFEAFINSTYEDRTWRSFKFLENIEKRWSHSQIEHSRSLTAVDDSFSYESWQEVKNIQIMTTKRRREEEELKDRTDQPRGTWEYVYRTAKRIGHNKNDLHERDEGELQRTGQPLCIYEPYYGIGTWPFLHNNSLYHGIGLSTRGRRPGMGDIDAPSRLPLLNDPYFRDVLGEYGAFFAIAYRIDRLHKNAWIGFQSWRATARQASLSKVAESALLNAIETRKHGDTLYFWVRMDMDPRNNLQHDFWSFCDAINAGNCTFAFSEAFKRMYGVELDLNSLPPMPEDGTWSVMQSWALPTRSFLEFVMFSRMFVDALDALMYDVHHQSDRCYLSLSKDKHCYSRLLELLVNVWAYHSARRMVYVNPETGVMQEYYKLKNRQGKMWVKWFTFSTLKGMDEDLAEEADSDHPKRRWLWPSTGEVVWQGVFERERNLRNKEKEKRKQRSKDKLARMRKRYHQKALGK